MSELRKRVEALANHYDRGSDELTDLAEAQAKSGNRVLKCILAAQRNFAQKLRALLEADKDE